MIPRTMLQIKASAKWININTFLCLFVYIDAHPSPFVARPPYFHISKVDSADTLRKWRLHTRLDYQPVKMGYCPRLPALGGLSRGTQFISAPGPPSGLMKRWHFVADACWFVAGTKHWQKTCRRLPEQRGFFPLSLLFYDVIFHRMRTFSISHSEVEGDALQSARKGGTITAFSSQLSQGEHLVHCQTFDTGWFLFPPLTWDPGPPSDVS